MTTPAERIPWTGDAMAYAKAHVAAGVLRIDQMGRVWRRFIWRHGAYHPIVERRGERRAENVNGHGYLRVSLHLPGERRLAQVMAHNLVYEVLVGPIPDGLELDHKNTNRMDNDPRNLEPVTSAVNTQRAYHLGRARPYAYSKTWRGRPRIDQNQELVARARDLREGGCKADVIAAQLGISRAHVYRITGGRRGSND